MNLTETSRYIALILRHKPETIDIKCDEHGWAMVDELIKGVSKTYPLTMEMLEKIVEIYDKLRFAFNENKTLIRGNQGHSISVDVELKKQYHPKSVTTGLRKNMLHRLIGRD